MLEHTYYGWLGILLKKFAGVKLIVHSHNIEATRWKNLGKWWWKLLYYYEKYTHRQSDYNLFIHEADRQFAIRHYGLLPERCIVATYGLEMAAIPSKEECREIKKQIKQQHAIAEEEQLLLFNGAFNYAPNLEALERTYQPGKSPATATNGVPVQNSGLRY